MTEDGWVGPWRPHRPRAPTAVQCYTPGPKYGLPGGIGNDRSDPSGRRAPAFSFGQKLRGPEETRSPGPQYLVPAGCTTRGPHRGPAFTMSGRGCERRSGDTPGPAHYSPERAKRVTLPVAPTCYMRFRGRPNKPQQTPGPATYQLPPVVGARLVNKTSAPEYTMAGRRPSIFEEKRRTPAPNNYNTVDTNVYMARAPRCTMAGRTRPQSTSDTPGPSDYSPKEFQKPGQTFGVRYSESVVPVMDSPRRGSGDVGGAPRL